eukprot:c379_g1_i1 orf=199-396(+)
MRRDVSSIHRKLKHDFEHIVDYVPKFHERQHPLDSQAEQTKHCFRIGHSINSSSQQRLWHVRFQQ